MKPIVSLALAILSAGCCVKSSVEQLTAPETVVLPDKGVLLEIAQKAITKCLPDMRLDSLELRDVVYRWYVDDLAEYTNEQFSVGFWVNETKKRAHEDGRTIFRVDTVGVNIEPDGRIASGGVSRGAKTFQSGDNGVFSMVSSQGEPILGDPFYPSEIDTPLRHPSRDSLMRIALRSIYRFLPSISTNDLILRSVSFVELNRPECGVEHAGFSLVFWRGSSVSTNMTDDEVVVSREEVTVRISTNGQVSAEGVQCTPGSMSYRRHALPEPWRGPRTSRSAKGSS